MAWPFGTSPPVFTFDPGVRDVPAVEAAFETVVRYLMGGAVFNSTGAQLTYTLKNGAGKVVSQVDVPAGSEVMLPGVGEMRPVTGLTDGGPGMVGLQVHIWGW